MPLPLTLLKKKEEEESAVQISTPDDSETYPRM